VGGARFFKNHLSGSFADDDRRRVRVSGGKPRHDRSVSDSQSSNPPNFEVGAHDCGFILTHLAGPDWMIKRRTFAANETFKLLRLGQLHAWCNLPHHIGRQRWRIEDPASMRDSCQHHIHVIRMGHIAKPNLWRRVRILGSNEDGSAALGSCRADCYGHAGLVI
jgi:hypothetical protein